jgi:hypothetical protein
MKNRKMTLFFQLWLEHTGELHPTVDVYYEKAFEAISFGAT